MAHITKEIGFLEKRRGKGGLFMQLGIFMRASGTETKHSVRALILGIVQEGFMLDHGRTICKMALVLKHGQTKVHILATSRMGKSTVRGNRCGQMALFSLVTGFRMLLMAL